MARIQWKGRHDALAVEHDATKKELELVNGLLEVARRDVEELKQQLVDAERRVMVARIEGSRDACNALLDRVE